MLQKLLIADDKAENRRILRAALCEEYDVAEAKDGAEALCYIRSNYATLSAILLDMSLPVLDVYEVLRQIRGNPLSASLPVIVLAASEDGKTRTRLLSAGADDFAPNNHEIIRHCLRSCIARRHMTYAPESTVPVRELLPTVLSSVIDSSADMSFIKGNDLQYVCCNRLFACAVGLANEKDIVGKTDFDLVSQDYAERYRAEDLQILKTGQPLLDYPTLIPSANGSVCYSSTSKYPLFDKTGAVIAIYGITRDTAKQDESYARLKLLNDSILAGIATFEVSPKSVRVLYINDGFCRTCGYSREAYLSIAGHDPFGWIVEEDRPAALALVQKLRSGLDKTGIGCYRCYTKGGGYRWFSLSGTVAEHRGDTVVVHAVKYDITEQKLAEEKLASASAQLKLLAENLPGGIATYRISPTGIELTYFNDGYCRIFGLSREAYAGKSAHEPFYGVIAEDRAKLQKQVDSLRSQAAATDGVYRLKDAGNTLRWVKCTVAVCDRQKDTVTVNLLLIDISEQYALPRGNAPRL